MTSASGLGVGIFPIRPPYILGETACSYALRLVGANGYDWRRSTFASRGIPMQDLTRGTTSALASLLDRATVERIEWFTPRASGIGKVTLCGEAFQTSQVLYDRQRFCVGCWAEDANRKIRSDRIPLHLRGWWSVAALSSCPIHSIRLDDHCADCSRTNRIGRAGCSSCLCGADLSRGPRIEVPPISLAAERYVVGRLGGMPRTSDPILDGLPLGDAVFLMQRLGCCLSAGRDVRFGKLPTERRPEMMLAGYQAVQRGSVGVEDTLEHLLAAPGRADQLRVQMGQLYCWFSRLPKGPLQSWMAERIANIVRRHRISWQGWDRHVAAPPTPERISASQAKVYFDASWDRTVAILDAAGLREDVRNLCRPTVDRSRVQDLAQKVDRLIDVDALALRIGVTPASVRKLAEAGILPRDRLAVAAFRYPKFDPIEIEDVLAHMAGSVPLLNQPHARTASIAAAARSVGIVPLCKALLDGRIAAIGRLEGRPALQAILVGTTGLAEVRRPVESPWIGLHEGCKVLGMRLNGLMMVIASGYIGTTKDARGHRMIRRADVDRFHARYISTTELARICRSSAKAVLCRLRTAGIEPVIQLAAYREFEVRLFDRSVAQILV